MSETKYVIRVRSVELEAHVLLNGATAFEAWDPVGRIVEYRVTSWLAEGENRLEIRLAPLPRHPDADEPLFYFELHRAHPGGQVKDSSRFVVYRYSENEAALTASVMRTVFTHTFRAPKGFDRWSFLDATPLGAGDRPEIEARLVTLHDALARRDLKQVRAALATRTTEIALGLEQPRARIESELDASLTPFFSADDWAMDPLDLHGLAFEPSLGGRLVAVRAPFGRPALTGSAKGIRFAMTPALSNVRGSWQVVR